MPSLDVIPHRDLAGARALSSAWHELHEDSGCANPFSGPDWPMAWWQHYATPRDEPYILEVRSGDRLVGVAAFRRQRLPGGLSRLTPVGSGPPWIGPFETPAMLALPSVARDVGRAVVEHLCAREVQWDWAQVALDARTGWLEPEWLPDSSFSVLPRRVSASVVFDLTPPESSLLDGRRNLKESLRRARNRLDRDFGPAGWSVQRERKGPQLMAAVRRLIDLHAARARLTVGSRRHADVLAGDRVRAYLLDTLGAMAEQDRVSIYELVAGGKVLAGQLILETSTAAYSSISGMDERAWQYSAVTHLQWRAAMDEKAAGRVAFNLSVGPNQAKRRWSDNVEITAEFSLVAPGRKARAVFSAATMGTALLAFNEARGANRDN